MIGGFWPSMTQEFERMIAGLRSRPAIGLASLEKGAQIGLRLSEMPIPVLFSGSRPSALFAIACVSASRLKNENSTRVNPMVCPVFCV